MELPRLVPIEYSGELVALVSARRVHIVAPWLLECPAGDPELRFVAYMCLCCGEVLNGRLPGPYTVELGEQWARRAVALAPAGRAAATSSNAALRHSGAPETTNGDPSALGDLEP
jgi:hypothetical protein